MKIDGYDNPNSLLDERTKEINGAHRKSRIIPNEAGTIVDIEVMPNSLKAKQKYLDLVRSAQQEIMLISPTSNAFYRQLDVMGLMKLFKDAAKRGVQVRILAPQSNFVEKELGHLLGSESMENIDIRFIHEATDTKATFVIIDKQHSLVTEIRDDEKMTFEEAIGFSIYSSSRPGVLSYVSIFENLWIYSKLYDKMKTLSMMQQEFINIAAHELRTPLQPIIGMIEILRYRKPDSRSQDDLLDLVLKNASRLQRLTENILDVTRLESQTLKLHKELFNLSELASDVIKDFIYHIDSDSREAGIEYDVCPDIFVNGDRARLTQVIINFLSNASKFTRNGKIQISLEKKKKTEAIFVIKDGGEGIDDEVIPHLFSKFTKSETGMGLGLYISKGIIDAHQGKIWAENNSSGVGATFGFSLPIP
jgi:signal transduction histidine kinase